jgi:chorismate mutase
MSMPEQAEQAEQTAQVAQAVRTAPASVEPDEALASIDGLRAQIDALDEQLIELLNQRAKKSLAIRALKPKAQMGLFDPRREEEIFERVAALNTGPLYGDDLRAIYATILRVSKEMRG